jgi:Flp pilus assembly protein TadG
MEFTSETKMMKRARPQTYRNEQGQTLTEFAMVLPILLLVLFAVIQLGIVFNNYVTITDAARAGARKAVVSRQAPSPASVTSTAVRNSAANLDQSKLGVTVSSTWVQGQDVTVTATYPYEVSLLGLVVQSGTLSSKTTERLE